MSVDLEVLRRTPVAEEPERRRAGAIVMGAVLVLGGLGWAALLLKDVLLPAKSVRTAAVRVETGGASRPASRFDATGWVEPEPFPTVVRPLVDGVVEKFDVVEGTPVKAGETVLARLRNPQLESDVESAERSLAKSQAGLAELDVDVAEAKRLLETRFALRAEVARLEGDARTADAERAATEAEVSVARSRRDAAQTELDAQVALEAGGSGVRLTRKKAEVELATAETEIASKQAAVERAKAAGASARAQLEVARDALDHPVALLAAVDRAAARRKAADSDVAAGETALAIARRYVDLLLVKAPVDGVVLRRKATPGSAVGPAMKRPGASESEDADGDLLSIYDPRSLQVRANVPLAEVSSVGVGQAAEVTLDALPGRTFKAEVRRLVSQADRNNNTLECKLHVVDPDPLMRPEMVARVRFLVAERPVGAPGEKPSAVRILVPRAALRGDAVFVFDPREGGRARRVPVQKVGEAGDAVEVAGSLSATQRVILDDVADGQRVADGGGSDTGGAS